MWCAACVAVGFYFAAGLSRFEPANSAPLWFENAALLTAIVLFLGSGPVAAVVGARRWLLAMPCVGLSIWFISVLIASWT